MAFTDPLSLENAFNAANSFVRTFQGPNGSEFIDSASTATEPRGLKIKHQVSGKGSEAVDRHLIQFYYTKLDAETLPRTGVVNTTLAVPRSAIITPTIMYNLLSNMIDLLTAQQWAGLQAGMTTTWVDKLLRGEQ
jgi:hypothetical protein